MVPPVHSEWGVYVREVGNLHIWLGIPEPSVAGHKLLIGQVCKLVYTQPVGVLALGVLSVVLINNLQVLGKDGLALIML